MSEKQYFTDVTIKVRLATYDENTSADKLADYLDEHVWELSQFGQWNDVYVENTRVLSSELAGSREVEL